MESLRQRRGLDEDDASMDDEIKKMPPAEIVRELSAWELGDSSWADTFASWMQEAGAKPEDFNDV